MTDLAVIMGVYQNDKLNFLKESVQSILDQTFSEFHYYVILDGPVYNDVETYLASIADNRFRLFRSPVNNGLAASLNYLLGNIISSPEYEFIARMDADDVSFPDRFEKQRKFMIQHSDVGCLGCWYQEIDEWGTHLADIKLPEDHEALRKRYYTRIPFAHSSVMYRRQLIEKAGYYPTDTVLMEDNVLWGRALKEGFRFANIPEYLFKFRKNKMFYARRSGIKYGWNFIWTRFQINYLLKAPVYSYFVIFLIGIIKIIPAFFLRFIYQVSRK